ncbi:unnamed protein product [Rotaria socialis]|uniref:Uncharacterized protein n=1 Tax=Rotaria socialis TaxID=392032 RepID=A0A817X8I5_9BILA|nr:unnamed protein product [Rotaria socialis]CAF3364238.1 unnamed protein product [Rotaria socialis]CAF3384852.1 unnamed protein product [Rotaria socialis]CAF3407915.1 unnamed protein product [Rotaria socialis]CAF4089454.1 unnamed protein product [Rotaria socialis]
MVTTTLNFERPRPSGANNEDDENNDQQIQRHLDRLYVENSQYRHCHHQCPQSTLSPMDLRDIPISINTVPVYRHGRKFYVSAEEFERMRAEERQSRRTLVQRSQNLPVSRSHQTNLRSPSRSSYNPIHRSTSHSHDHRYGILRAPHLPTNSIIINDSNSPHESTRESRSTFRHYNDRDDLSSVTSTLPIKLSATSTRSNSSDRVIDLRRTPQPSVSSYTGYIPNDYELKRSFSAELVQPSHIYMQQPQVLPRRIVPFTTSNYGMSAISSFPTTPTDQLYNQSKSSKVTSYFDRKQPSALTSPIKQSNSDFSGRDSTYERDAKASDYAYSVLSSSNRRIPTSLPSVLTRSASNNSNDEYHLRGATNEYLSDDNSSSPSMLSQRRTLDTNRYRPTQLAFETDVDCERQTELITRATARSQSSDGLTEKKRVRFADMEGFTLETVSNIDQNRLPMNNQLLTKQSYIPASSNLRGQEQSIRHSLYPMTTRVANGGSKLATDV